jgi:murein DD-endopeptidase MepM/ murein hydrolase activator NlpD
MFSIANRYTVTVGELAYANGMQASDAISPGQVLIIPDLGFSSPAPATAVAAAGPTGGSEIMIGQPGAAAPLEVAAASPAAEPAPADSGAKFLTPVSGPIAESYTAKRGGVEFGVAPGTPVRASEDGVVVLVSKSLGGLGTIILVRHNQEYMTVYGRVKNDRLVEKGQKVKRGQTIATVAEPTAGREPSLHFEIRRGTDSIDPEPLI